MKRKVANIGLIINIILILVIGISGVFYESKKASKKESDLYDEKHIDDDVYKLNDHTLAEFSDVIIEQFNKESQLVVSSADASINVDVKQTGVFDVDVLNKSQRLTYKGTGRFYVDMSMMDDECISFDKDNKAIIIKIPHTELMPIDIDPERFESEDAKRGFLAFGDLKFSPKEYNELLVECKTKITKQVDTTENRIKADENALSEVTKIYDPIVKSIDDEYHVEVAFSDEIKDNTK